MIQIIIITALIVLFFHVCTWKGMVFSFVSEFFKRTTVPDYLKKPLYDCPVCATVWWGPVVIACGILGNVWIVSNYLQLAIILSASAGLNAIFIYIINQGKAIAKTLDEYDCNCTKKEDQRTERLKRINQFVVK